LNRLPEVKKFLKQSGGVDLYPDVTIDWIRGHNPDLYVYEGPSSEAKRVVDLGAYKYDQLHRLFGEELGFRKVPAAPSAPLVSKAQGQGQGQGRGQEQERVSDAQRDDSSSKGPDEKAAGERKELAVGQPRDGAASGGAAQPVKKEYVRVHQLRTGPLRQATEVDDGGHRHGEMRPPDVLDGAKQSAEAETGLLIIVVPSLLIVCAIGFFRHRLQNLFVRARSKNDLESK